MIIRAIWCRESSHPAASLLRFNFDDSFFLFRSFPCTKLLTTAYFKAQLIQAYFTDRQIHRSENK
jgi:hypothetical protein